MSDLAEPHTTGAPLGKQTEYPSAYDPGLLFAIPRSEARSQLGLVDSATRPDLPFRGTDLWNAYELSWLGPQGKPEIRAAQFRVPCDSTAIVESKSLKLYLNSLNQHRFDSPESARATIAADLSAAAGESVDVRLYSLPDFEAKGFQTKATRTARSETGDSTTAAPGDGSAQSAPAEAAGPASRCLDDLEISIDRFTRAPELLRFAGENAPENARDGKASRESQGAATACSVYTNLFKSNCPVTGQPDWASVFIEYSGPRIDEAGLLAYLVSYRNEQDFHEHCVEQIFVDLNERCRPEKLTVYACFLRRGGIDINPFRSNYERAPEFLRSARQ